MKIKTDLGSSFSKDVPLCLSLFDTLVKPILLYACDFWGCLKMKKSNPIENFYMSILKQISRVQRQTTNTGVLLEMGKFPIAIEAKRLCIKNWERIKAGKANFLVLAVFKDSMKDNLPWISSIKNTLETNGYLSLYLGDFSSKLPFIFKKVYQRLIDTFHQESFESMRGERSKLRTYGLFKKEIGFEPYLTDIENISIRSIVTKFRLSNHKLMIELGRHQGIEDRNERVCPFCPDQVEDEFHFLLCCPIYKTQRKKFVEPIIKNKFHFSYLSIERKMEYLLCKMDREICHFIANSMEIRDFLVKNPRIHI